MLPVSHNSSCVRERATVQRLENNALNVYESSYFGCRFELDKLNDSNLESVGNILNTSLLQILNNLNQDLGT